MLARPFDYHSVDVCSAARSANRVACNAANSFCGIFTYFQGVPVKLDATSEIAAFLLAEFPQIRGRTFKLQQKMPPRGLRLDECLFA